MQGGVCYLFVVLFVAASLGHRFLSMVWSSRTLSNESESEGEYNVLLRTQDIRWQLAERLVSYLRDVGFKYIYLHGKIVKQWLPR